MLCTWVDRAGEAPDGAPDPGGVQADTGGPGLPPRQQGHPPGPESRQHPPLRLRGCETG